MTYFLFNLFLNILVDYLGNIQAHINMNSKMYINSCDVKP